MADSESKRMPQTISIAMATYNGARYLREQLDSFAAQTRLPDELVVRDDCSSDETVAILEAFAREAPFPVRISRNETNLGLTKNFEAAIEDCTGDLIFLSDQDDVWFPEKLATVEAAFAQHPEAMVVINDAENTDENLGPSGFTKSMHYDALGLGWDSMVVGCCTAFRKEFVPVLCPIRDDGRFLHDAWLHLLACRLQVRHVLPRVLQYHRRHGGANVPWFAGHLKKLRFRDRLSAVVDRDRLSGFSQRIDHLAAAERRLMDCRDTICGWPGGRERWQAALDRTRETRQALEARVGVLRKGQFRRLLPALLLFARGGYVRFHGWRSLALDMFLP